MRRTRAPRRRSKPTSRGPVQEVVDETIALYQWLAWVADDLYGPDARGAARRWTLRRLAREGPQTVPALAKGRAVRRQTLQPIVDALVAERLVTLEPNAAHARSSLVAITARGLVMVERFDRVDRAVLGAVSRGIGGRALEVTAATLRALRSAFELTARWRPAALAARDQN